MVHVACHIWQGSEGLYNNVQQCTITRLHVYLLALFAGPRYVQSLMLYTYLVQKVSWRAASNIPAAVPACIGVICVACDIG